MFVSLSVVVVIGIFAFLTINQAAIGVWAITNLLLLGLINRFFTPALWLNLLLIGGTLLCALAAVPILRQYLSAYLLKKLKPLRPRMSSTEKEALEAGDVSWEGHIFKGKVDFTELQNLPTHVLSTDEQAFIDGPLQELCRLLDDWQITHHHTDLPENIWNFIKKQRFFGMIIPKQYGGLEFSATAQTIILTTVYGRSITAATTISVPNSLGPAELLLHYGTKAQQDYYLPRLACGTDIPCFALTSPQAGSDAASITDSGVICRQIVDNQEVLGMRLTWSKRYITLCPVATVIGLAFKLYDPDNLLGQGHDLGITCALIPANTPGVNHGRRHFPLNTGFLNGPTHGHEVFVPLDVIIGGPNQIGQGWRMLMECLSAGRAISLPSSAVGGARAAALSTGAYARIRRQFKQPIASFEGIEEPLARIAGQTYIMDAALSFAAAAVDNGARPAVAGAILKYHTTERARQVCLDAMDVHGGKGICLGPRNYLGRGFQNMPISITVEGANILTRSLIIFGQGVMRCHPYIQPILNALDKQDVAKFHESLWSYVAFYFANATQSVLLSLTDGYGIKAPASRVKRYYQLLSRYTTQFAFLMDFCLALIGGDLKRKEKLSGRLGDMLSMLYLLSAVLKRYHDDGEPPEDLPLVQWCCQDLLMSCESALAGIITNFPYLWGRIVLRIMLMPWGRRRMMPSDKLGAQLAQMLSTPNETRNRLTRFVFKEPQANCPIGRLEQAFLDTWATKEIEALLINAIKAKKLTALSYADKILEAQEKNILNETQAAHLMAAEAGRQDAIAVDDFDDNELRREF